MSAACPSARLEDFLNNPVVRRATPVAHHQPWSRVATSGRTLRHQILNAAEQDERINDGAETGTA